MRQTNRLLAVISLALAVAGPASAQCMLANPSFDVPGSAGAAFGGWNQFGPVASTSSTAHGPRAALVTGPNTHVWDVSGVWQPLDCSPGQKWDASVCVSHSAASPLTGGSQAILNIEWRDAGGNLISYESHVAADATTPAGTWRVYSVQSQPAPAGTASIHFVLGVLQGPTDPAPVVSFDAATCVLTGPPTLESLQWNDFPSGRTLDFGARTWRVKGSGYYGPGPNLFDGGPGAVWVDANGRLHLTVRKVGASWYSTEVALADPLGYGDYVFTTRGRLDLLHPNVVLGLFLWEYGSCYDTGYLWWNPYNEIDVEFSRWGSAANPIAQFVAQPASTAGNLYHFNPAFGDTEVTSHAMRWLPQRVEFRSWRGGPNDESAATRIASWTYLGMNQPRPEHPRVHLNLWQIGTPTSTQEVVFDTFTFHSACPSGDCGVLAVEPPAPAPAASALAAAAPNPSAGGTTLRWRMAAAGRADLSVFDLAGRRIRSLAGGTLGAGEHAVAWDGRNESGMRVAPGVYLYRLRAAGVDEARRVVILE